MKSPHQERVEHFMRGCNQVVPLVPVLPPPDVLHLRATLILEECLETIAALGYSVWQTPEGELKLQPFAEGVDLVDIADGCADIAVVTTGTLSACGIQDEELQQVVDLNNLSKLTGDFRIREDGKLINPSDWKPPDIPKIIEDQRQRAWDAREDSD